MRRTTNTFRTQKNLNHDQWREYRFNQMRANGVQIEQGQAIIRCKESKRLEKVAAFKIVYPSGKTLYVTDMEIESDWRKYYLGESEETSFTPNTGASAA